MSQGSAFRPSTRPATPAGTAAPSGFGASPANAPTSLLPTPEALLRQIFGPFWNVAIVFGWITLPLAFINAIGEIRLVITAYSWVIEHAGTLVVDAIEAARPSVKAVIAVWREATAPLRDWLAAVLPFHVPDEAVDLITANAVCAPSLGRLIWALTERRRRGAEYARVHGPIRFRTSKKLQAAGYQLTLADRRYNQALALATASLILSLIATTLICANWLTFQ